MNKIFASAVKERHFCILGSITILVVYRYIPPVNNRHHHAILAGKMSIPCLEKNLYESRNRIVLESTTYVGTETFLVF